MTIQQFATELFKVEPGAIQIGHVKHDAVWSVEANYAAMQSVAATSELGTGRINGTQLFEQALNMKTPTIYDTLPDDTRVVNQEQTMAAKEKQKQIKERFKSYGPRAQEAANDDSGEKAAKLAGVAGRS